MRRWGFVFDGVQRWIGEGAADAALTYSNTAVPPELSLYVDPKVVEILTAPRAARLLLSESKKGDWQHEYFKFRVDELVGREVPYSDNANDGSSDVNSNWLSREQYRFQTTISYGELEMNVAGLSLLDLVGAKQRAAATILDVAANKYAFYGVAGKHIYGFLNDPNLPAAQAVGAGATSTKIGWSGKLPEEIYADILECFQNLVVQTQGLVTQTQPLKLALTPGMSVHLAKASQFNVSVQDMLNKFFSNLEIVPVPELNTLGGERAVLFAPTLQNSATAELPFSEKLRTHALIQQASSYEQKYSSTTYGCVIYYPMAFSSITGMESGS
jgi:hypothetical protein